MMLVLVCSTICACKSAESGYTVEKAFEKATEILDEAYFPHKAEIKTVEHVEKGKVDKVLLWVDIELLDFSDESDEIVLEAAQMSTIRKEYVPKLEKVLSPAGVELVLSFYRYNGEHYGLVAEGKFIEPESNY